MLGWQVCAYKGRDCNQASTAEGTIAGRGRCGKVDMNELLHEDEEKGKET